MIHRARDSYLNSSTATTIEGSNYSIAVDKESVIALFIIISPIYRSEHRLLSERHHQKDIKTFHVEHSL
jgi:hypothetical protein